MNSPQSCILAIDAGGTFLKAALADESGILADSFFSLPVSSGGAAGEIAQSFTTLAGQAAALARQRGLILDRIGLCIPGPFDCARGVSLMTHKYQSIRGLPVAPWLHQATGVLPTVFLHDANACLLGARRQLQDRVGGCRSLAAVTLGTGLGFGSILEGQLQTNSLGGPGVSIYARPYLEGSCEDYASQRAVLQSYSRHGGRPLPDGVRGIAQAARQGDAAALAAFQELGGHLGAILLGLVEQYSFQAILLGGAISKSADLFLPALSLQLQACPGLILAPAPDIDLAPLAGAAAAAAIL